MNQPVRLVRVLGLYVSLLACVFASPLYAEPAESRVILEKLTQQFQETGSRENLLFWPVDHRRVAFKNIRHIFPTRTIEASETPYELSSQPMDLGRVTYAVAGESFSISDFTAMASQVGLIVVKDDDVLYEHYAPGNDRDSQWMSFSVTKSVTSMLVGAAIKDGYIQSVDEPVVNYLPRLRGTGYENTTIRNVLNMASGVRWNEDYADPESDVSKAGGINGLPLVRYLSQLPTDATPGEKFNYSTAETNLIGEILRAAIGNNAATYLTHRIWQPFGMESDAYWALGEAGGGELGGCCINATLRDYARVGIFAMQNGTLKDGAQVLPPDWMKASTAPSAGYQGYGYLWWLYDEGYAARGIFGQMIRIDPEHNLVIVVHSNAPTAVDSEYHEHMGAAVDAIRAYLAN